MLAFQQYQLAFTAHLRDPKRNPKPDNVIDRRMAVYREIVFNNIVSTVSACFPVCQQVIGARRWRHLCRLFFAQHACKTPLFREIPQEFLHFIATTTHLPAYLPQLAHYEWLELMLSGQTASASQQASKTSDLLKEIPLLTPVYQLLAYDYPVQKISAQYRPKAIAKTFLLLFRTASYQIRFIVLSPMTYWLLTSLQAQQLTGEAALKKLAAEIQHPDVPALIAFGLSILQDLQAEQAIIGTMKPTMPA